VIYYRLPEESTNPLVLSSSTRKKPTVTQENRQEKQNGNNLCGWMGVEVRPMTAAFAASLGMAVPYGAIFDQPEMGSPAAKAHIEQGDVLTAINGSPLMRSSDFAGIISKMAPGTTVYVATWRNGEARQITLTLGSAAPVLDRCLLSKPQSADKIDNVQIPIPSELTKRRVERPAEIAAAPP
jgi:predicted metalloprotease with PDZ domain